jgi:hypothetical protein
MWSRPALDLTARTERRVVGGAAPASNPSQSQHKQGEFALSHVTIPDGVQWRKSSRSVGQSNCVELAVLPDGEVAVRNSNRLGLGALPFTKKEMAAFVGGAKDGDFDDMML